MPASPYLLALHLGGAKISAAVFNTERHRIGEMQSLPTMGRQRAVLTLMNLKRAAEMARRQAGLEGPALAVGMASVGSLDKENGCLLSAKTLPQLADFQVGRFVEQELSGALFLEREANCIALAEALHGAGKGHRVVLGVCLDSEFGCGVAIDGRIDTGVAGSESSEPRWCAADLADGMLSTDGVKRLYATLSGTESPAVKELGRMAERGHPEAIAAWNQYAEKLGSVLAAIAAEVRPSICVLGGSIARRLPLFRAAIEDTLRAGSVSHEGEGIRLEAAQLDNAAAVTGAAEYAFQQMQADDR